MFPIDPQQTVTKSFSYKLGLPNFSSANFHTGTSGMCPVEDIKEFGEYLFDLCFDEVMRDVATFRERMAMGGSELPERGDGNSAVFAQHAKERSAQPKEEHQENPIKVGSKPVTPAPAPAPAPAPLSAVQLGQDQVTRQLEEAIAAAAPAEKPRASRKATASKSTAKVIAPPAPDPPPAPESSYKATDDDLPPELQPKADDKADKQMARFDAVVATVQKVGQRSAEQAGLAVMTWFKAVLAPTALVKRPNPMYEVPLLFLEGILAQDMQEFLRDPKASGERTAEGILRLKKFLSGFEDRQVRNLIGHFSATEYADSVGADFCIYLNETMQLTKVSEDGTGGMADGVTEADLAVFLNVCKFSRLAYKLVYQAREEQVSISSIVADWGINLNTATTADVEAKLNLRDATPCV